MQFQKAVKSTAKLRLAITGPSGSGKTFSALKIASGLGKRIALIDTENHSASLYADNFEFDAVTLSPPYTLDKYMEAIKAAVSERYDVLIIDSISHAWAGEGGLLEKKGALDVRGGNSYTNWAPITKEHEQFKSLLLTCDIHLIVTMRSKQDYIIETSDKGKSIPRKVGLAPIQREGMEYEFTMVLDMAMDHNATVSKTRVSKYDGKLFQPSKETGEDLLAWLNNGVQSIATKSEPPTSSHEVTPLETVTFKQAQAISEIREMLSKMNGGDEELMNHHLKQLTKWKDKNTKEEKFLQLNDLTSIAHFKPDWFKGVLSKVTEEYQKAFDAEGKPK